MIKITNLIGRRIFDSRGKATVEVDIHAEGIKHFARSSAPSGASKGKNEAYELRDQDGSVKTAVEKINQIIRPAIINKSFSDFREIDQFLIELDGTANKENFGANTILPISISGAKLFAMKYKQPLFQLFDKKDHYQIPVPLMNLINGGAHADNNLSIQEFMIVPSGFTNFQTALEAASKIITTLKEILKLKKLFTGVGDEGGFAPNLNNDLEALDILMMAIEDAGFKPGVNVFLALDVAANEFYRENFYHLGKEKLNSRELIDYIKNITLNYPIFSIEDPLAEDDYLSWIALTKELKNSKIIGDDIFVSNKIYLQKAIENNVANAILIKPNQVGTITEMEQTINMAKEANYDIVLSHRSGETEDVSLAHFAVGFNAPLIKSGSLCRSERVAKYNELLRIEDKLSNT